MVKNNQVKLKDKILITIKKIGINGEGVGYYKRQAIFVDGALPGEEVEVEITEVFDNYAYGEITKWKVKSVHRVEPKCPYYGRCGGCQLQHLDYEQTLVEKQNIVLDSFSRYFDGDIDNVTIYPTIGMDNPYEYRNKSNLPVRHDGEKVVCGLYHKNTNKLVYIDKCMIESKLVSKIVEEVLQVLTREKVDVYNPKLKTGSLRFVIVRAFEETKEGQVTLVVRKLDRKLEAAMKKIINIENVKSVYYSINDDLKSIELLGQETIKYLGNKEIKGKLGELNFLISPTAFFQLNTKQTTVLYDQVKKACSLTGKENILDLYCGIGSIGLYLAKDAKEIRGIDINRDGIDNAKKFAKLNKIDNASFYYGNILPHYNDFLKEGFVPDILICDPPRKGMDLNLINFIKKTKVKKIIYVSCNPSTLTKNLNHLQNDYNIVSIQPVDMFPWTSGVECVCQLLLKNKKK